MKYPLWIYVIIVALIASAFAAKVYSHYPVAATKLIGVTDSFITSDRIILQGGTVRLIEGSDGHEYSFLPEESKRTPSSKSKNSPPEWTEMRYLTETPGEAPAEIKYKYPKGSKSI